MPQYELLGDSVSGGDRLTPRCKISRGVFAVRRTDFSDEQVNPCLKVLRFSQASTSDAANVIHNDIAPFEKDVAA